MNSTVKNLFTLNQILLGKSVNKLPENVLRGYSEEVLADIKSLANVVQRGSGIRINEATSVMLRFLRLENYPAIVTNNGAMLPLFKIAELCREQNIPMESSAPYFGWLAQCVDGVEDVDATTPTTFTDGSLYLRPDVDGSRDIQKAIFDAFALYTWGTLEPSPKSKSVLADLLNYTRPTEAVTLTDKGLIKLLLEMKNANLYTEILSKSVLNIPDYTYMFELTGALICEHSASLASVDIILPTAKGACVSRTVSMDVLLQLAGNNPARLSTIKLKKDTIVVEDV